MEAVQPRTNSLAVVSLIFGLLAWSALPIVGAIVAVVCGHTARGDIRNAPPANVEGEGLARAGLILGWMQLTLAFLVVAGVVVFTAIRVVAVG